MKPSHKRIVIFFFILLFTLIVLSKIETRICSVCGVQDYNVSLGGKTIEFLSQREYDEFDTHKKYKETFGTKHQPHQWILIEEKTQDVIQLIDSL